MNVSYRHPGPFAVVGLIAAFVFALVLVIASNGDPAWVYGENTLVDLGNSSVQITADVFNYGCMVVGLLTFVFGIGKSLCETGCNRASGCLAAIAGIFLIALGYLGPEFGNENTETTITVLIFLFMFIAMVVSAIGDSRDGYRLNSALSVILLLVIMGSMVGGNAAMIGVVFLACSIVWMIGVSIKMIFAMRKC